MPGLPDRRLARRLRQRDAPHVCTPAEGPEEAPGRARGSTSGRTSRSPARASITSATWPASSPTGSATRTPGSWRSRPSPSTCRSRTRPSGPWRPPPAHWRAEADFPAEGTRELTFHLGEGGALAEKPGPEPTPAPTTSSSTARRSGLGNGYWSAGGISYYLADDQRGDEAYSLVYTTPPLEERGPDPGLAPRGPARLVLGEGGHLRGQARRRRPRGPLDPDRRRLAQRDPARLADRPRADGPGRGLRAGHPDEPDGLGRSSRGTGSAWRSPGPTSRTSGRPPSGPATASTGAATAPRAWSCRSSPPARLPAAEFPTLPPPTSRRRRPRPQQVLLDQITGAVTVLRRSGGSQVLPDNRGTFAGESSFRCTASANDPAQASIVGTHTFTDHARGRHLRGGRRERHPGHGDGLPHHHQPDRDPQRQALLPQAMDGLRAEAAALNPGQQRDQDRYGVAILMGVPNRSRAERN